MKISYNWLKDYLTLKEKPPKIAEALTLGIAEVEKIEELGKEFEGIVIGEVLEVKKHPHADRLFLTKVKVRPKEILEIVCGAKNVRQGQKVPVALVGTILPDGTKIEIREIRGIKSYGMICSEKELGLGYKTNGIMVLDSKAKVGESFKKYLGLSDYIFEIDNKSLTHRSDLFSHIGFARELSVILGRKLKLPKELSKKQISKIKPKIELKIKVQDKKLCPRYMAAILDNVKISESPKWMQRRLQACGIRPINNVVDITNYVMLEWGQPLHAFDYEKIIRRDGKAVIMIRQAKKDESIVTIDGKKWQLDDSMLIIADSKKPIAIAGIMGGKDTEVSARTKTVILESANFDQVSVRRTSQKLGLRTEAVTRFEKGLGLDLPENGLRRAIDLLQEYADAKLVSKIYDLKRKIAPKIVKLDLSRLFDLVGMPIAKNKILKILRNLEFKIENPTSKILKIFVPLFRTDIKIQEDLIEEVARIFGYANVKPKEIFGTLRPVVELPDLFWAKKINQILVGAGFFEVYNYSFYGEKLLSKCKLTTKDHIALTNPLSPDLKYLRASLLPRLFENLEKNVKQFDHIKLFEIGKVFILGCEGKMLSGVLCGNKDIFFQAKGVVELLFEKLNISYKFEPLSRKPFCEYWNMYRAGRSVQIKSGSKFLGTISELDLEVAANFGLEKKCVAFFDLFFEEIAKLAGKPKKFKPLPKYPEVLLDLAIVLDKKIPAEKVEKIIYETGKPLLQKVELFDVYSGAPLAPSEKNFAFHLTYRAEDRTLKDFEVKEVQRKIVERLEKEIKAKVRA